ncbi:MAG: hypothetical protein IT323_13270 [Anaerolineae bacterium]|nr:hypothetical protein [Anaerolineae bacterium]
MRVEVEHEFREQGLRKCLFVLVARFLPSVPHLGKHTGGHLNHLPELSFFAHLSLQGGDLAFVIVDVALERRLVKAGHEEELLGVLDALLAEGHLREDLRTAILRELLRMGLGQDLGDFG